MKITLDFLKAKVACVEGITYFKYHWKEEGDYQEILDKLAEDDRPGWAHWLLDTAGSDSQAIKTITGPTTAKHVFASGKLVVSESLDVGEYLEVRGSLNAGGSINIGEYMDVGGCMDVGGYLNAGGSINVYFSIHCKQNLKVGLRIFAGICPRRLLTKEEQQVVCSKLVSGTVAHGELIETNATIGGKR